MTPPQQVFEAQQRSNLAQQRLQSLLAKKQSATDRLAELRAQVLVEYGTDDPARLAAMISEIEAQNAAAATRYASEVAAFEQALRVIEGRLA
jgi:hypothetical protein